MPKNAQRLSIEFQEKNKDLIVTKRNMNSLVPNNGSKTVSPRGAFKIGQPGYLSPSFDMAEQLVNNRLSSRRESKKPEVCS